jgi:hypothetical protein
VPLSVGLFLNVICTRRAAHLPALDGKHYNICRLPTYAPYQYAPSTHDLVFMPGICTGMQLSL